MVSQCTQGQAVLLKDKTSLAGLPSLKVLGLLMPHCWRGNNAFPTGLTGFTMLWNKGCLFIYARSFFRQPSPT